MTSRQRKIELLTFGYINESGDGKVVVEIVKLIKLFYDDYFYWTLQKNEMKQFFNAKNGDILHSKSTFMIKSIEFELTMCPNGWKQEDKGYVALYLEVKHMPSNIDWIRICAQISCDTININRKFMRTWWKTGNGWGMLLGQLSEFKDFQQIDCDCNLQILSIKYKQNEKKMDYILPIKMNKFAQYQWKIDDEMEMKKMKKMHQGMSVFSDNFDNHNWCISIFPKGFYKKAEFPGKLAINIDCLQIPFGIISMNVRYSIELKCESKEIDADSGEILKTLKFVNQSSSVIVGNRMCMECPSIDITKLFHQKWLTISVQIEIVDIYDLYSQRIDQHKWKYYGLTL